MLKNMRSLISGNGLFLRLILKMFTKLVGAFILLTKLELLNKYFLFQKLMKNVTCFLKRILVNLLLLKNLAICILGWFKFLLNHSPERVLMLLFLCVYVMLDLRTLKIAFLIWLLLLLIYRLTIVLSTTLFAVFILNQKVLYDL